MSLPNAGINFVYPSLLDLQCSPPPAVLSQSRSVRVCPTRRLRAFTPLNTSTQAEILSQLSILESRCSSPNSDAPESKLSKPRSSQKKNRRGFRVSEQNRKNLSRLLLQRFETSKSSCATNINAGAVQQFGTGRSNRGSLAIAVAQQLSRTKSLSQTQVVKAVTLKIR